MYLLPRCFPPKEDAIPLSLDWNANLFQNLTRLCAKWLYLFRFPAGYGNFTFKIDFYKSSSFATPYTEQDYPLSVPVNQYLYVRYSVESSADLVIMAVTCRATKTGSLYSWPQYSIILNGYVCYSNILVGMIFLEKIRKFQSSSRYFISPRFLSIKTSVCLRFVVPYLAKAKCKVWRLSVLLKDNFQRFTDSNGWTWTI